MPFRTVHDLQQLEDSLWREPGPGLWEAIRRVWELAARTNPRRFPPGIYKHRSPEDARALKDEWQQRDFDGYWDRQKKSGIPDPRRREAS